MSETIEETEVKNPAALLAKNKELLAKLKGLQTELEGAQTALQAAKTQADTWRSKWHQATVMDPLDASLESVTAGPAKYLRTELIERGILKMEADADGIERPSWFKDGEKFTPPDTWKFLADLNDPVLSRMIRGSGASGSGAQSTAPGFSVTPPAAPPATVSPPSFGLR